MKYQDDAAVALDIIGLYYDDYAQTHLDLMEKENLIACKTCGLIAHEQDCVDGQCWECQDEE